MFAALLLGAVAVAVPGDSADEFAGFSPALLLNDPAISARLDLSDMQTEKLRDELRTYLKQMADRLSAGAAGDDPKVESAARAMQETEKRCMQLLAENQSARLKEICWQLLGVDAFFIQAYRDALGIDERTYRKIAPSIDRFVEAFKARRREFDDRRIEEGQFRSAMSVLEVAAVKEIVAQLGPQVREEYERRTGAATELSKWSLRNRWPLSD